MSRKRRRTSKKRWKQSKSRPGERDKDGMKITLEEEGGNVFFQRAPRRLCLGQQVPCTETPAEPQPPFPRLPSLPHQRLWPIVDMLVRRCFVRVSTAPISPVRSRNRMLFALALCRIQYRLLLHEAGIGSGHFAPRRSDRSPSHPGQCLAPPRFAAYSATI